MEQVYHNGITLYIVGPGAPNDYYLRLMCAAVSGATKTLHPLPYQNGQTGFGTDTMVIHINGPCHEHPWRAEVVHDNLLTPAASAAEAARLQALWEATPGACGMAASAAHRPCSTSFLQILSRAGKFQSRTCTAVM